MRAPEEVCLVVLHLVLLLLPVCSTLAVGNLRWSCSAFRMDPIRTPTVTPTKQNQHPQTFDPDSPAKTPAGRKSEVKSLLRSAPGSRGPTPTSCEGCRRLRVKCVRENGGQVGTESCASCNKRGWSTFLRTSVVHLHAHPLRARPIGMECRVPQEITSESSVFAPTLEAVSAANLLSPIRLAQEEGRSPVYQRVIDLLLVNLN
jgi:hypothetical protein